MRIRSISLFKPIDLGVKFEITLKLVIVALFSCLLFGSAVYKLFESSLVQNEKKMLLSYKAFYQIVNGENPKHLSAINRLLHISGYWILDKNLKPLSGEGESALPSYKRLKKRKVIVIKKGCIFAKYQNVFGIIPLKNGKFLVISKSLDSLNGVLTHLRELILFYVVLTTLLVVILLNYLLKASIINPLHLIIKDINEIKSGGQKRVSGKFLKEFNYLINNFNELLQHIDTQSYLLNNKIQELRELNRVITEYHQEMSKFERLASIGELSAGIAHEIGNPLNNIQGYLSLIKDHPSINDDSQLKDYVNRIESDIRRMDKIVKNILDYSRKNERLEITQTNLIELIEKTLSLLVLKLHGKEIDITRHFCRETIILKTDAGKLEEVLLNLISNAFDSIEEKGRVEISVEIVSASGRSRERILGKTIPDTENGKYVLISIKDNGEGIGESELPHVFDPFFTTKAPGKGTGLGLSVSLNIMRELGGTITLKSERGEGTTAQVILPYS